MTRLSMRRMGFALAGLAAASAAWGSPPESLPTKRGDFAFHYARKYSPEEMTWYGKFDIVVTGDLLPPEQVDELRAAGCKLIFYEWLVAFYRPGASAERTWERMVLDKHPEWLLNPTTGLRGHSGSKETPAYYYDPVQDELRISHVQHIIEKARRHKYSGVFFDTTGFASVHPAAQRVFKQRHPNTQYDIYVGKFLALLRKTASDLILFTNQGYRHHAHYLPHVDYDLTESYMTATAGPTEEVHVEGQGLRRVTETYVHPWYKPGNLWDSVAHYCKVLINDPIRTHGYKARIYHLNYGQPRYEPTGELLQKGAKRYRVYKETLDREALYYGIAAALLMGQSSYYQAGRAVPADDVYFIDLSNPLGSNFLYDQTRGVAWRIFANGIVTVNDSHQDVVLSLDADQIPGNVVGLWNVFTGKEVHDFTKNRTLTIPTSRYAATQRTAPAGRIFVFLRPKDR